MPASPLAFGFRLIYMRVKVRRENKLHCMDDVVVVEDRYPSLLIVYAFFYPLLYTSLCSCGNVTTDIKYTGIVKTGKK